MRRAVDVAVHAAGFAGLGWGLWQVYRQNRWSHDVLVPWINGISQRLGDDRPPIPDADK